jgi:hypothetical protein
LLPKRPKLQVPSAQVLTWIEFSIASGNFT